MKIKQIKSSIASLLLKCFLNGVFLKCKWKVHDLENLNRAVLSDRPVLICSWHQRFLFVAKYFKNFSRSIWAISSTHQDSEIMAGILTSWKWKLIRGSSTRGWRNVIVQMTNLLKVEDSIIAITNDGPKGPAKIAKKGSVSLAIKNQAHIIAISCSSTSFWKLQSWDKTYIPKPFSTIHVRFSAPLIYKTKKINEVEAVSDSLNEGLDSLDLLIKK